MNFRMIGQVVGRVLCIEAALMLLPMIAALAYDESPYAQNPAALPRATVF